MLVSLCAVDFSPLNVGAVDGSNAKVQATNFVSGQLASGTGPAVCSQDANSLDVFVQGTDHALWYRHYQAGSGWSAWRSLGGGLASSPGVTSQANGKIDVFVRGTDGAIWYKEYSGSSWSNWIGLGGQVASGTGPAASSWGTGRLDVFVQGTDGVLYQKMRSGSSWSTWKSLSGALASSPAATSPASGVIDVCVCGTDGALWSKYYKSGWGKWTSIDNMSQIETPTVYYVPQTGSTWVNQGTAGASYDAFVSTPSLYRTQSNGHSYWGDIGKDNYIYIPAGSATNNQNVVSWEIGFHFAGIASGQRYQKIWDKAAGGFSIYIDTLYGTESSLLTVYRTTTNGSTARWYIPTDTMLRVGHNYYVQISWDTRAGPGHEPYPTIWIGEDGNAPVHQTHWDETLALSGTGSWYNDAVGGANLGNMASNNGINTSAKTSWLVGGIFVYRQYNSIIDFSNGGSWGTDKLRWI